MGGNNNYKICSHFSNTAAISPSLPPKMTFSSLSASALYLYIQCAVLSIIDRIVRLIARLPIRGKFTADDCLRQIVALCVLAELEPLMLDDTSPRSLTISVVHCGITLKIGLIQQFRLKADRTILYRVLPQCFTEYSAS